MDLKLVPKQPLRLIITHTDRFSPEWPDYDDINYNEGTMNSVWLISPIFNRFQAVHIIKHL